MNVDTDELIEIAEGPRGSVFLTRQVDRVFGNAEPNVRARILRYMNRFAELGQSELNAVNFKFEARLPVGASGTKIAIYAFKAWKTRVYGAVTEVGGKMAFIGTAIDTSKKQDKANQRLLRRAADKFGELN